MMLAASFKTEIIKVGNTHSAARKRDIKCNIAKWYTLTVCLKCVHISVNDKHSSVKKDLDVKNHKIFRTTFFQ